MRPELPVVDKVMVASAGCHSRLLHGTGGWPLLSASPFKKLAAAYHKPLRMIAGANRKPDEGFVATSNESVRGLCRLLPLEWALAFARLRIAPRPSQGHDALCALIQSPGGAAWRLALQWALKALAHLLSDNLAQLPCPLIELRAGRRPGPHPQALGRRC